MFAVVSCETLTAVAGFVVGNATCVPLNAENADDVVGEMVSDDVIEPCGRLFIVAVTANGCVGKLMKFNWA